LRLFVAVCEERNIARAAEREAVQMHAASQVLALAPLTDAWAERRFVMCVRGDGSAGATTRALVEALRLAAAGAR
jgi:hypothetical protein